MSCRLAVRVTPRGGADRVEAVEFDDDGRPLVRLRVRSAPADGEANAAVIRLIAKALGVPRSSVRIARGETARTKTLEIDGLEQAEVLTRLSQ